MAYCTRDQVRGDVLDPAQYSDGDIDQAIAAAEDAIDNYVRTRFEYKAVTAYGLGRGSRYFLLRDIEGWPILQPRSIVEARVDTVVTSTTGWKLRRNGALLLPDTVDPFEVDAEVEVDLTAGLTSAAPPLVVEASVDLARMYARTETTRIDPRATSIQNDYGTVRMASASPHPDRAFSIPEITARLSDLRQLPAGMG